MGCGHHGHPTGLSASWSSTHQGNEFPPWKAPEPWDSGGSPSCASHSPHTPFSLPRRLPNRVPSLRMLRSFFTDGVSGECVWGRECRGSGSARCLSCGAQGPEMVYSCSCLPSPALGPIALASAVWAPASLRDTCTLAPKAGALAVPPSRMPFPHTPPRPHDSFGYFLQVFRTSLRFLAFIPDISCLPASPRFFSSALLA